MSTLIFRIATTFLLLTFINACDMPKGENNQSGPAAANNLDRETSLKYTQYWTQGRMLYKKRCMNCHQNSGKGMAQLIPPLAGSDFLTDSVAVACIIRYGQQGKMVVNDTTYEGIMPANPDLSPLEIAELVTYIRNSWGNAEGFSSVLSVERWLNNCNQNN